MYFTLGGEQGRVFKDKLAAHIRGFELQLLMSKGVRLQVTGGAVPRDLMAAVQAEVVPCVAQCLRERFIPLACSLCATYKELWASAGTVPRRECKYFDSRVLQAFRPLVDNSVLSLNNSE